jgi:hypothetical protein
MGDVMRTPFLAAAALLFALPAHAEDDIAVVKQKSQALYDALLPANPKVWDDALAANAVITDENGTVMDKKAMVASVTPFPAGISGHIVLTDFRIARHGDTVVEAYVVDEHEDFHGQHLHALYDETATWVKEGGDWKLLGMETLAAQQDPPSVQLADDVLDQYAGRYRAAPDLVYEITRKDHELLAGVAGGKPAAMKMELLDVAFAPGQPRVRKLFQRDSAGHITGFLSRREGRDVVWTKVN